MHGGAGSRKSTPVSSPAKASGAQHIKARLQECKQFVDECKATLKKRGFLRLYRLMAQAWDSGGHSYDGPLWYTAKEHLSGEHDHTVRGIYREDRDMFMEPKPKAMVSEAELIKPTGENRAMIEVLIWANVDADKYDQSRYFEY
jgi:hypothetical protein